MLLIKFIFYSIDFVEPLRRQTWTRANDPESGKEIGLNIEKNETRYSRSVTRFRSSQDAEASCKMTLHLFKYYGIFFYYYYYLTV